MENWQIDLKNGFRTQESLFQFLSLSLPLTSGSSSKEFPIKVPLSFAQRMEKGNSKDPLLLQILPSDKEDTLHPNFKLDAVGDLKSIKQKGFIQKYQGRVLLILSTGCAVHCRYCFRKHFPYENQGLTGKAKEEALQLISNDQSIEEVIFSGGDPLLHTNETLFQWAEQLTKIKHLKRWRIHSRIPCVLPTRMDDGLLKAFVHFQSKDRQTILVNHFNHPNEINEEVQSAFKSFSQNSILLLNQSVLLKDINDNISVLKSLSEKLFSAQILPYYLHLLDRTQGTHHFEVPEDQALQIYKELSSVLPGYLVPKLVREVEGTPYKVIYGHF